MCVHIQIDVHEYKKTKKSKECKSATKYKPYRKKYMYILVKFNYLCVKWKYIFTGDSNTNIINLHILSVYVLMIQK